MTSTRTIRLSHHEWLAIASFAFFLLLLTTLSWLREEKPLQSSPALETQPLPQRPKETLCEVLLVPSNGSPPLFFPVLEGTRLEDLAFLHLFGDDTDLSVLQKERKIRKKEVLRMRKKSKRTVSQ